MPITVARGRRTIAPEEHADARQDPLTPDEAEELEPRRPKRARAIWARRRHHQTIRSACSCATSATPNCSRESRRSRWRNGWRRGRRRRWRRCASARRPSPRSPPGATRCRTGGWRCATWSSSTRRPVRPGPRPSDEAADPALEEGLRPETLARLDAILAANAALRTARRGAWRASTRSACRRWSTDMQRLGLRRSRIDPLIGELKAASGRLAALDRTALGLGAGGRLAADGVPEAVGWQCRFGGAGRTEGHRAGRKAQGAARRAGGDPLRHRAIGGRGGPADRRAAPRPARHQPRRARGAARRGIR